jgi:glycosyltransferase involved in cell wall biosynthesis
MRNSFSETTKRFYPLDVSVVTTVFNKQEAVGVFLDSLTYVFGSDMSVRLEIIFVNDGSTDETLARAGSDHTGSYPAALK